mgnify:CR=1 FL=1|tara:strand:- start:13528 stop:14289 length:762 start_codon:yes stop_codon:yes gene_type:complete
MHVPGHNPFIDEILGFNYSQPYTFYNTDYDVNIPEEVFTQGVFQNFQEFNTPQYAYQGISPEIMGAITNVFNPLNQFPAVGIADAVSNENLAQYLTDTYGEQIGPSLSFIDNIGGDISFENVPGQRFDVNIFDPESIAAALSQSLPDGVEAIKASEVKALTPEMIEKTTSEYYSPYEESQRESLVEKLGAAMGKAQTGGFAGSGARQSGLSGAERLYRGGYGDILSDIMKMRGQATGDVLDTIYGYQELLDQG